jgi:xylulokinase
MYTVCKLANLRRCADYFPRIAYFPLFEDFVIHRLTGERVISYSLASRTMGLDVEARDWAGEVFEAAGIDVRLMSRPVASGTIAGPILPEVAREVGVGGKLLVVTGGHDQMCVAVGSGALDDGIAANGAGTVEALSMTVPSACDKTRLCSASYSYSIHGDPASRFTYAFCPSGSVILNWYVNAFGLGEIGRFADGIRTPPRPGPLLILPYFSGSGTPHLDADATGVFSGMTLETTKEDIYVALLEGLAHDLAVNIGRLGGLGIPVDTIRAAGGGASSPLWLQIKADVTGKPVCALRDAEAGALGCVMLAAAAIGRFRNLREAARAMIAVGETYPPDPARHEQYKERTLQFQELYETSRGFARRI